MARIARQEHIHRIQCFAPKIATSSAIKNGPEPSTCWLLGKNGNFRGKGAWKELQLRLPNLERGYYLRRMERRHCTLTLLGTLLI